MKLPSLAFTTGGRTYRPRFAGMVVIVTALAAVLFPIQHYLDGFIIPFLRHHGFNRFTLVLIFPAAVEFEWYLLWALLIAGCVRNLDRSCPACLHASPLWK